MSLRLSRKTNISKDMFVASEMSDGARNRYVKTNQSEVAGWELEERYEINQRLNNSSPSALLRLSIVVYEKSGVRSDGHQREGKTKGRRASGSKDDTCLPKEMTGTRAQSAPPVTALHPPVP